MGFKYVDLFAGIGGFHAALSALGGECVLASDIDEDARRIYADNWNHTPVGDINDFANENHVTVPDHDVLVGGFPCQPFSKSGRQLGMEEARGTLFWNIAKIIEAKQPKIVLLENVRNLVGPRHIHEWEVIIKTLRDLGYRVSEKPLIVSPHQIKPEFGGRPQVRDRVLIAATKYPKTWKQIGMENIPPHLGWALTDNSWIWNLRSHLPLEDSSQIDVSTYKLTSEEKQWIKVWDSFLKAIRKDGGSLPGFPLWFDSWGLSKNVEKIEVCKEFPQWKNEFIEKNLNFYLNHKKAIKSWFKENPEIVNFPASRRKFEWQAQDAKSIKECILHFRPSGIRVKKATYVPALVAINQTSILGDEGRKLTIREATRLQGFPEWFKFRGQTDNESYKQLGNAVNVGVIYQVLRSQVRRDFELLLDSLDLVKSILNAPDNPDLVLSDPSNLLKKPTYENIQLDLNLRLIN